MKTFYFPFVFNNVNKCISSVVFLLAGCCYFCSSYEAGIRLPNLHASISVNMIRANYTLRYHFHSNFSHLEDSVSPKSFHFTIFRCRGVCLHLWNPWTNCDSLCGQGTQTRTMRVTTYAAATDMTLCPASPDP